MSVTVADFESLQAQLLHEKTENYSLLEQLEAAKRRSSLTPQQMAEKLRNDNYQLRLRVQQQIKESETLSDQLKLVRISHFLQSQAFWDSPFPDLSTIPPSLKAPASEVMQLLSDVKQQLSQKSFLDTQVNELQKRSKSLGRAADSLQATIDEMRAKQKSDLAAVDAARDRMQRLEAETSALRDQIQEAASPRTSGVSADDVKSVMRKVAHLEDQIRIRRATHEQTVAALHRKVTEYGRRLDDAAASETVLRKKAAQKVCALQTEINKRRGIVVHSSRAASRADSAQLFLESKRLIGQLAAKQQEVWELEERVAFSRNALDLLGSGLVKRIIGVVEGPAAQQMALVAKRIVEELAAIDRQKNVLLSPSD